MSQFIFFFHQKTIISYEDVGAYDDLDHFVLVIGYGTQDGIDFWLCQNFWGANYREDGYFRIERNAPYPHGRGTTGIARRCYLVRRWILVLLGGLSVITLVILLLVL